MQKILEKNSLSQLAIDCYAKRLTPQVQPELQLLLDEATENALAFGSSKISRNQETNLLEVKSTVKTQFNYQLGAIAQEDLAIFILNWKIDPLISNHAGKLGKTYDALTAHLAQEIITHGHLLRYINNVAQVRVRDSDRYVKTAPKEFNGEEFLTLSKDADNQTASLGQLNQAQATPFTDAQKELLTQFETLVPLPAGIGTSDGARFEEQIELLRKKFEQSMSEFSKRLPAVKFNGFFDSEANQMQISAAQADGQLKLAKANIINNGTN